MAEEDSVQVGAPSAVLMALYQGNPEEARTLAGDQHLSLAELAAFGDLNAVAMRLQESPTAVHEWSPDGWTPLHLAAFFGHAEIVVRLLRAGADHTVQARSAQGNSALHAAIAGRLQLAAVTALLSAGADPAAVDRHGYAPIHLAASRGDRAVAELLLACGADPGVQTRDGKRAADIAMDRGYAEVAAWLRSRAGNPGD